MVLSWDLAAELHPRPGTGLSYLQAATRLNWSGVTLFFVLSGFLIGGILIDNREAANYFRVFYIRRVCRIFPLYYLWLISFLVGRLYFQGSGPGQRWLFQNQGVAGLGIGSPNSIPLWSYALYWQNWWMAKSNSWGPGWLGISWSLAIEEQFYLVLPIVILYLKPKWIGVASLSCLIAAPLARLATPGLGSYCLLTSQLDALMAGVFIAWLLRLEKAVFFCHRYLTSVSTTVFIAGLFCLALIARHPDSYGVLGPSFLMLFYGSILILSLLSPSQWLGRSLKNSWLGSIGRISYGIYLMHMFFIGLAHAVFFGQAPRITNASQAAVSVGALIASIAFAYLSYVFFEQKVTAIGQHYKYEIAL
ncbi:MAG: acyltransferase [Acidobacteriota bacterium]|nr:acyltransferase [Acidobacteriota bacterium]